jgi:hypothetical protein
MLDLNEIFEETETGKTVVSTSVDDETLNMILQLCDMQNLKRAEVIRLILVHYRKKLGRTTDFTTPK